ncbi:MAG TPA: DUF6457 domain-containing protein [Streptosporangiaceae bacterium]|jgi:hypothetical protein
MSTLEDWTVAVCAELGVDQPDTTAILDLAREVAHGVARPAAPLTAYLVGTAVGAGLDPAAAVARVTAMAQGWPGAAEAAGAELPESYGTATDARATVAVP